MFDWAVRSAPSWAGCTEAQPVSALAFGEGGATRSIHRFSILSTVLVAAMQHSLKAETFPQALLPPTPLVLLVMRLLLLWGRSLRTCAPACHISELPISFNSL